MKILVTGGAGYVGSVTVVHLLDAGHEVVVFDNLSHGNRDVIPENVRFIQGDLKDISKFITKEDGFDAVMHFAGLISAGESMSKPEIYWENNSVGSLNLINTMRDLGIKKLIFSSTAAVYGNPSEIPVTEDSITKPTNTYGMTKLSTDMAIESECIAHGLAATSLRFFNVAGAYGKYGERHPVETHIIPIALEVAAGHRPVFSLFGDDYPTPDGTCIRDYVHVADLARAHLLALDNLKPSVHTKYNLGNGTGFSNKELIDSIEKVTGKKIPLEIKPKREGDPVILIASNLKAKQDLGWVPLRSTIDEIVKDAWVFHQKTIRQ